MLQNPNNTQTFEAKKKEFQAAMDTYHQRRLYNKAGIVASCIIISLQIATFLNFCFSYSQVSYLNLLFPLVFSWYLTDFINGLIHLYMDNNTNYRSIFGPFVAAFHLHHLKPQYKEKSALIVYFTETGSKFWLLIYLGVLLWLQYRVHLSIELNFILVAFGILSSFAELSHYWCHNSRHPMILFLQQKKVLLSRKHHFKHHAFDNINYAFLNGMSDPLINIVARKLYSGYKSNADLHAKAYQGCQTNNR